MQSLGQLIGMVLLNPLSDKLGRKWTLYVLWTTILAASLMLETFVRDWKDWTGAKIIGVGAIQSTMPVYVTEWSPVNIRGAMVLTYGFRNSFGKFLPPMVLYISQRQDPLEYKMPILTQWGFLGIMLPIFFWIPETAAYYASRGQDDKRLAALRRVNGKVEGYNVEAEYSIIRNTILEEKQAAEESKVTGFKQLVHSYVECFKGPDLMRTIGSTLPICSQQLTGLAFLNVYASLFFRQSGFNNAFLITTIQAIISLITATTLIIATDKFGRRLVVLSASICCTFALLLVGILGQVGKTPPLQNFLIFTACLWALGSNALGQLGWAFVGEVSAQRLRARTAGLAAGISVLFGLTFNTAVPVMLDIDGADWGYNTAWLFFATGLIVTVLIYFYVPEPSRRNYAEMEEMYRKRVPARKMQKYVTELQLQQQEHWAEVEKLGERT